MKKPTACQILCLSILLSLFRYACRLETQILKLQNQEVLDLSSAPKIVTYVTGHGFGHAVRVNTVLAEIRKIIPDVQIVIKTASPNWLFRSIDSTQTRIINEIVDAIPAQKDAFTLDYHKTFDRFAKWLMNAESWIAREAAWLEDESADLVLADICPLALGAARVAGIRSALVANFTWDWILSGMARRLDEADSLSERLQGFLTSVDWVFQVEPSTNFETHSRQIRVGPVGRSCAVDRVEARRVFSIPDDRKAVLLSFGGLGASTFDCSTLDRSEAFVFISTRPVPGLPACKVFDPRLVDHSCLIQAADVLVGKLGYSTVIEAVLHGTPFLYCPREDWPEEIVLEEYVKERLAASRVPPETLTRGLWEEELIELSSSRRMEPQLAFGGNQIARILAAYLSDLA